MPARPQWGPSVSCACLTCCLSDVGRTDENEDSSWISVALDLVNPKVLNAIERFLAGDVVDEEDSMRT